jgi:hypothetical protein
VPRVSPKSAATMNQCGTSEANEVLKIQKDDGQSPQPQPQPSLVREEARGCMSMNSQDERLDHSSSADLTTDDLCRTDRSHSMPSHSLRSDDAATPMQLDQADVDIGERCTIHEYALEIRENAAGGDNIVLKPSSHGRTNEHAPNSCTSDIDGVGNGNGRAYVLSAPSKSASPISVISPASVQVDNQHTCSQASLSRLSTDTSKYPPSCIVKVPAGSSPGDRITIRWPTIERNGCASDEQERATKRLRSDDKQLSITYSDILVNVTLPRIITSKKKGARHIQVFAPWITAKHAAANTLTTRQLRSIGIDGHDKCNPDLRHSRQQHIRNHGEGQFSEGHSRIGNRYQVSAANIPSSGTWAKNQMSTDEAAPGEAAANYDQIWDTALSEEANAQGEPIYQYIDSLHSFQKARGMMTLHQSAYKVSSSEEEATSRTASDIPLIDTTEPVVPACQSSQTMLEGRPFTQKEKETFREALVEHRKQWPKIAQAVGTSVNRCLVYYYSAYKAGEGRDNYLVNKKLWEQSDECEVCHDGGDLICCDGCINSYHMNCITPTMHEVPSGVWLCPECVKMKAKGHNNVIV